MLGLGIFKKWWIIGTERPKKPDVIVAIGYGSLPGALMGATEVSILTAVTFAKCYPSAVVAFANASHCFPDSEVFESSEKRKLFSEFRIATERLVESEPIVNSVTEAERIQEALHSLGILPREMLLITDRFHGRSIQWIWGRTFPGVRLVLCYTDYPAYQPNAPFPLQRSELRWLFANVARQLVLRVLGLDYVRNVQHHAR